MWFRGKSGQGAFRIMNWELGIILRPDASGSDHPDRKLQIEWPYQPQTLRPYRSGESAALRSKLRDIRSEYWKHIAEEFRQVAAQKAFAAAQKQNASAEEVRYRGVETAEGPSSKAERKRGSSDGWITGDTRAATERSTGAHDNESELSMVKAWVASLNDADVATIHRQDVSGTDKAIAVDLKRVELVEHITQLQRDNHWVEKNSREQIEAKDVGMKTGWHTYRFHKGGADVTEDEPIKQNLQDVAGFL